MVFFVTNPNIIDTNLKFILSQDYYKNIAYSITDLVLITNVLHWRKYLEF